jgi:hypothetical protein
MSIALDGFEVLRRLGKHADAFAVVRADVDKAAGALVLKCLKAKSTGINELREIHKALGPDQFGLVLENLKDAEMKAILTRLDKHHPELKGATSAWRRPHMKALAEGSSDPSSPPPKPTKKATAGKKAATGKKANSKSEPARLQSEVMEVFREGGKSKR